MPSKLQFYAQMADHTAEQITGSYQKWTAFLTTAARLYKYPYHEQLMIFAQRPEATARADYDLWNKQMRRYVRQGSKGIALIDTTGDQPRLKYVFDVSDTGGGENSRRPFLWAYRPEHQDAVTAALARRFEVSGENGLADQLERVAAQLVDEFWNVHQRDILDIVADSFLEEYDDFNIGVAFRNAAVVSTTYMLLSRCGMEPGEYFEHEDFLNVFDFNTPQTIAALGTAISQSSEQVLRQIEVTIKNYERQKLAERSESHERADLREERGLPDSRPEPVRAEAAAPGQVRQDAEAIDDALLQKPESFDALLKLLREAGYEIKGTANPSLRGGAQKRFIRMDTLGKGYTPEDLRAVLSGKREHTPKPRREKKSAPPKRTNNLIVDIQAKLRAGKGAGYERWATLHNLKQMAQTVLYLQEHKLLDYAELSTQASSASARFSELSAQIKSCEKHMAEIAVMRTHILNYIKTRDTYVAYRKAGYSKKFLSEHESDIALHKAAKQYFDAQGVKKLPTVKSLNAEYAALMAEKKAVYPEYRKAREDMKELLTAKANVDRFLGMEEDREEPNDTKEKETEQR